MPRITRRRSTPTGRKAPPWASTARRGDHRNAAHRRRPALRAIQGRDRRCPRPEVAPRRQHARAMTNGIALHLTGHTIRLKWHRLRRERGDPVFTAKRLNGDWRSAPRWRSISACTPAAASSSSTKTCWSVRRPAAGQSRAPPPASCARCGIAAMTAGRPATQFYLEDLAALVRRHPPTQARLSST